MEEKEDSQLILETLQGSLSSFEVIVRRYQKSIWWCTFKILKDHLPSEETPFLEKLIQKEMLAKLRAVLKQLPAMYFKPIRGYYFENLSYQTLAENLNLSINTVRTRMRRGKIILTRLLENQR